MEDRERGRRPEPASVALTSLEERARLEYESGNYSVAERLMRSAVELDGADASTYFNLGQILYASGDYLGAIEAYGLSVDEVDDALLNRGLCWEMVGEFDKARADYLSVLRAHEDDVDALVNVGTLELGEGNIELAKKYLLQAAALDEKCNWQLADAFLEDGDFRRAERALELALKAGESRAWLQLEELRGRMS
ncbi:tetratricopeptide repeat protein [Microbacterium sp. BWR-S6Y]